MPEWYVAIPSHISTVAFFAGGFSVRWYALSYLVGFFAVWILVRWRVRKGETKIASDDLWDAGVLIFLGGILGGRLGWLLLYGHSSSIREFFLLWLPWNTGAHAWTGWYGMSFFGALAGAVITGIAVARRKGISFFDMADAIIPAVPLGIFFGRVGNFLNGELFGKETESVLAMRVDGVMRHPSSLYEAILEGLFLFGFLWFFRNKRFFSGSGLALFGMGYGIVRCIAEFFRQESEYFGGVTQGQLYSVMLFAGCAGWMWWKKGKYDKLEK